MDLTAFSHQGAADPADLLCGGAAVQE